MSEQSLRPISQPSGISTIAHYTGVAVQRANAGMSDYLGRLVGWTSWSRPREWRNGMCRPATPIRRRRSPSKLYCI